MKQSWLITTATAVCAGISAAAMADRSLIQEAVIDAPVAEVWRLFTTDEGVREWMAPRVKVDLRVGGELRTSYNADSTLDDEDTIVNRVLSYLPGRMIAIRNVQAPTSLQHGELFKQAWSVVSFDAVDEQRTNVRIAGLNYGEGPQWDVLYDHFDKGNAYLLGVLQKIAVKNAQEGAERADALLPGDAVVSEVLVKTSRERVWRAWTTAEGIAEFFAPQANVDMRIDGEYELHFAPDAPDGQRGSEGCRVLVYEPLRMLSFSWNAPPQFPGARPHHTWVVLEFEDADAEHVRVRLTQMGFDLLKEAHPEHAGEFEQTRVYFDRVWPHVLASLKARLEQTQ